MSLKITGVLVVLVVALTRVQPPSSGLDLGNFDPRVRPQDDLFRAVNGGWLARTPIPPDRVTFGTFLELADKTESDLRAIIEGVAADRDGSRLRHRGHQQDEDQHESSKLHFHVSLRTIIR